MALYYVKATGSNTPPFNSPSTAAPTFNDLLLAVSPTISDTIQVEGIITEPDGENDYYFNQATIQGSDSRTDQIYISSNYLDTCTIKKLGLWTDNDSSGEMIFDPDEISDCRIWFTGVASQAINPFNTSYSSPKIINNLFYNFSSDGGSDGIYIETRSLIDHIIVVNNTFANCTGIEFIIHDLGNGWTGVINKVYLFNNIFVAGTESFPIGFRIKIELSVASSIADFQHDHNCANGSVTYNYTTQVLPSGPIIPFSPDATEITADPLFLGSGPEPYQLQQTSPCKSTGITKSDTPVLDLIGIPRPNPPSIGAFDFLLSIVLTGNVINSLIGNVSTTLETNLIGNSIDSSIGDISTTLDKSLVGRSISLNIGNLSFHKRTYRGLIGNLLESQIGNIIVGNKKDLYVVQRTNRHIIKKYDSTIVPATYTNIEFGVFRTLGSDNRHLNFPNGLTVDSSNNIYICDTVNKRILKLNSTLNFVSSYDTSSTIGEPYVILFNSGYLYTVGVYGIFPNIRIEKLNTSLNSLQCSDDLLEKGNVFHNPTSISLSFDTSKFLISGVNFGLYEVSNDFITIMQKNIIDNANENPKVYFGMTKIDNYIYLNNGEKLLKVDSTFSCVGKSKFISKTLLGLKRGAINTLLFYNFDKQKIVRYDENLNFVEDVIIYSGSSIDKDTYEIVDYIETLKFV